MFLAMPLFCPWTDACIKCEQSISCVQKQKQKQKQQQQQQQQQQQENGEVHETNKKSIGILYHIISYHIISYHIILYYIILYPVISHGSENWLIEFASV